MRGVYVCVIGERASRRVGGSAGWIGASLTGWRVGHGAGGVTVLLRNAPCEGDDEVHEIIARSVPVEHELVQNEGTKGAVVRGRRRGRGGVGVRVGLRVGVRVQGHHGRMPACQRASVVAQ